MIEEELHPMSHWNEMYGFSLDGDKFSALLGLVAALRQKMRTNRPAVTNLYTAATEKHQIQPRFSIRLIRDVLWELDYYRVDYEHLREGLRVLAAIDQRPPGYKEPLSEDLPSCLKVYLKRRSAPPPPPLKLVD